MAKPKKPKSELVMASVMARCLNREVCRQKKQHQNRSVSTAVQEVSKLITCRKFQGLIGLTSTFPTCCWNVFFISNPLELTNGYMTEIYLLKGSKDQQNYLKSVGVVVLLWLDFLVSNLPGACSAYLQHQMKYTPSSQCKLMFQKWCLHWVMYENSLGCCS